MKPQLSKINKILKEFLKYFFIILTFAVIGILYPNRGHFNFEYAQGTKWTYETLKSPFDFPIIKNQDEITQEKKNIKNNYIPRFLENSQSLGELSLYIDNITLDSTPISTVSKFKAFLKNETSSLYKSGIINVKDISYVQNKGLVIDNGTKTVKKEFNQIYTNASAKDYLKNRIIRFFPELAFVVDNLPLKSNLSYDSQLNSKLLDEMIDKVSPNSGIFKQNEIIINSGEVITKDKYKILESYKSAYIKQVGKSSSFYLLYIGYFVLSALILAVLLLYLHKTEPFVYSNPMRFLFILMWIMIFSYIVFLADKNGELYVYAIPFAIVPVIIMNFFKKYLALYLHIVIILIASLITKLGYEFTVLQIVVGMVTILIFSELRFWNIFFKGIFFVLLTYIIGYISLSLINTGSLVEIEWKVLISFVLNALMLLLAYPLIPLIEKPFGFVSKITISELGDLNKPLLKELSLKAPGTLQHSLQVANLCEAAAEKIGANSLLIKVGALYHDIGKTYAPEFFIENQRKDENPYAELDYFDSAEKIIQHVTIGEKMAKKHKLPKILQRFIITHHGTTRVEYFYRKQVNEFPDKEFDETLFRYPGPKPKTKEEAIMMIADSLEAAAKSLNKPTIEDIDSLVRNITKYKIDEGQLEESELTFEELQIIQEEFKSLLKNIHHVRIKYPELKK